MGGIFIFLSELSCRTPPAFAFNTVGDYQTTPPPESIAMTTQTTECGTAISFALDLSGARHVLGSILKPSERDWAAFERLCFLLAYRMKSHRTIQEIKALMDKQIRLQKEWLEEEIQHWNIQEIRFPLRRK